MLTSACCSPRPTTAYHSTQTENHPRLSIYLHRKVCLKVTCTFSAHNGEYILHPVAITLRCSDCDSESGSFGIAINEA